MLFHLNLSQNTLTGCLSSFLPDAHPGLPQLGCLYLKGTALNKDDLHHLKHLLQDSKLPKLYVLHLEGNELYQMKEELKEFVETCFTNHHGSLTLYVTDNGLSTEFLNQLKQCC